MWKIIASYIDDHRDEIDLDEPGGQVWRTIEQKLDARTDLKRGKRRYFAYYKAAAAVVLSVGLGYLLSKAVPENGGSDLVAAMDQQEACADFDKKQARMERTFLRSEELVQNAKTGAQYPQSSQFLAAMDSLRPVYLRLTAKIKQNGCSSELVKEVKDHQRTRINWMTRFSDHIEEEHQ
ncbi:MAG: hypothetical protein AB8H47_02120 [Bacteroidia bacterium]